MLRIFDTTLVCVDCRDATSALLAISICLNQAEFDEVVFLTDQKREIYPGKVININKISSIQDYSYFIFKNLHNYINTKYLLICQHDGFIINPSSWDDRFYQYDYIGAPWQHHGNKVGNGGFSFRSLRLHKILSEDKFTMFHPEDEIICSRYCNILTQEYKIRFAPKPIAEKFSLESSVDEMINKKPFGFHGRSCVSQAIKMTKGYKSTTGIKCYLKPFRHIPLL